MAQGKEKRKRWILGISMPQAAYERIEREADTLTTSEQRVYPSDVGRIALREYFERRGEVVNVDVDRGGYRERKDTE